MLDLYLILIYKSTVSGLIYSNYFICCIGIQLGIQISDLVTLWGSVSTNDQSPQCHLRTQTLPGLRGTQNSFSQ